ncbi:hypothetical protein AHAS_Ahas01G0102900 [Arachis hypogaea]
MISRGLKVAREIVIGNEQAQYGKLNDYLMELYRSNPRSTAMIDVKAQPESLPLFNKLYISLDACKMGFKDGCRPLIGLDKCFLKGYYGGQLLFAVGQDANNHFFVIAYAVVLNEWVGIGLEGDISESSPHELCTTYLEELHQAHQR